MSLRLILRYVFEVYDAIALLRMWTIVLAASEAPVVPESACGQLKQLARSECSHPTRSAMTLRSEEVNTTWRLMGLSKLFTVGLSPTRPVKQTVGFF